MHQNILVADSGATKTAWRLIGPDRQIQQFSTSGFNPFTSSPGNFLSELKQVFEGLGANQVYFYGAGCRNQQAENIKELLQQIFRSSVIEVADDLLAAARATCNHTEGIGCILGTGANSCFFDGQQITDRVPSLGFILGDEGSGAYLGKTLVNAFFKRELPEEIHKSFVKRFKLTEQQVLEQVYRSPAPSKFLAGFARYLLQNLQHPWVFRLVYNAFELFFEKNLQKYPRYREVPVHFTGGTAFYFSNVLRRVAQDRQVNLQNILENPIAGLALFHQQAQP